MTTRRAERRPAAGAKVLPEDVRRHNRVLVLQTLFDSGPASRADLARSTGLTRSPSATWWPSSRRGPRHRARRPSGHPGRQARHAGRAAARRVPGGGRRPVRARPLPRRRRRPRRGDRGAGRARPRRPPWPDTVALVEERAAGWSPRRTDPVLGIGVASPGLVDDDGVVLQAPNLGWSALPLARLLGERLDQPVRRERRQHRGDGGVHLRAQRQPRPDAGAGRTRCGCGSGAGRPAARGPAPGRRRDRAAVVDEKGAPCACGRTGCLETVLSVPALRASSTAGPGGRQQGARPAGATWGGAGSRC